MSLLLALAEAVHRLVVFHVHAEEVVGRAVELLLVVAVFVLAVLVIVAVAAPTAEGTFFTVLMEAGTEGFLEAAFSVVAAEVFAEGAAFAALFTVALEAGAKGLAERTVAVFTFEALAANIYL